VPHLCESIMVWKDVLENRNIIHEQIRTIIQSKQNPKVANEVVDIPWNQIKLASVARKHELPSLAREYIEKTSLSLREVGDSEIF